MAETTPKKRPYHQRLVEALVRFDRLADVCKVTGLSARTVHRWRQVDAWRAEVQAARGAPVQEALAILRAALPDLAAELVARARDASQAADVRVRAAEAALSAFNALSRRPELLEPRRPQDAQPLPMRRHAAAGSLLTLAATAGGPAPNT